MNTVNATTRRQMRVRPFERIVTDLPERFAGRIDGSLYVVTFGVMEIPIPVVETGVDGLGQFALLHPLEQTLAHGFRLTVEPVFDEFAPAGFSMGCEIRIERRAALPRHAARVKERIDPSEVAEVLLPPGPDDVSRSVTFNHGGGVSGWSWFPPKHTEPLSAEDRFFADVIRFLADHYGAFGSRAMREESSGLEICHPVSRHDWYWTQAGGKWHATVDPPLSTIFDEGAQTEPSRHVQTNIPAWSQDVSVVALGIAAAMELSAALGRT